MKNSGGSLSPNASFGQTANVWIRMSPNQNAGIAMPRYEAPVSRLSPSEYCRTAE